MVKLPIDKVFRILRVQQQP